MLEKTFKFLLGVYLLAAVPAIGQDILLSETVDGESVTIEQIDSALAMLESRQGIDEETRKSVGEYLLEAQLQIQNRNDAQAATAKYAAALESAPVETNRLRTTLDEASAAPPTAASFEITDSTTLAELQQMLATEAARLAEVDSRFAELEKAVEAELDRPSIARNRMAVLRQKQEELSAAPGNQSQPNEPLVLSNARRLSMQLARDAQGAELSKLDRELVSHSVRMNLLQTQRDVAARQRLELTQRTAALRSLVNESLESAAVEAQQRATAAEQAMADEHPVLRGLAETNAQLTREIPDRAAATQRLGWRLEQTKVEVIDIQQRLARSERWLEIGGLSRVLGSLMIAERRSLPQLSRYHAEIRDRNSDAAAVGLDRMRVQEQRHELASVSEKVQELMAEMADDTADFPEAATSENEIRALLTARRDLLVQVENSYGAYLRALGDLDIEQHRLLDVTDRYQQFLAQNLLWIPSAPVVGVGIVTDGWPSYPQALTVDAWLGTAAQLVESLGEHAVAGYFCAVILILLLLLRKPLLRNYESMSKKVGHYSTDSIGLTIGSLAIVVIRVLPIPLLMILAYWFLNNLSGATDFSMVVAQAMAVTAPFVFYVLLFAVLCAPAGILGLHFGWQEKTLATVRRPLHRLGVIGVPLLFMTVILFFSDIQSDRATTGRIAFILLMVFFSYVIRPILRPETGAVAAAYRRYPRLWLARSRWIWYGIGVGLPLLLAVVSGLGFLYTSTTLAGLLVDTFWQMLVLMLGYLVILRWLALARRRLASQIAAKDREVRQAEKENEHLADAGDTAIAAAEAALDIEEVDLQARKLLQSAMLVVATIVIWKIWADVLPAFSFLSDVSLWTQTAVLDGVEVFLPVTLANLILAMLIIVVTVIASRNLPGLMEILVLQRLTLEPGSRYAINTLLRYIVVTVGTFSVLSVIGWDWGQIQWLVAALSVGLGFGLQEIVANFISGIIILFERPIRVGDTVTVGQLTGTVSRVRIRATTITDWDRKEILVPNKAFITEQVVNWTLSDPITRVVIPVGVAYGSDAELTQKVMFDTLVSLPLVLDEPAPKVYFTGFGDSSLNFTLHAYLRQLSDRMPLVHEVHETVLKALHENGIKIPFPQREVHIRSRTEDS